MRNRLHEWQYGKLEYAGLNDAEAKLEQLAIINNPSDRDQAAIVVASSHGDDSLAYILAEAATRRRAIVEECKCAYSHVNTGMKFAAGNRISFELARSALSNNALMWLMVIGPILIRDNKLSVDTFQKISEFVLNMACTRQDLAKVQCAVMRKGGFFDVSLNDDELLASYKAKIAGFELIDTSSCSNRK